MKFAVKKTCRISESIFTLLLSLVLLNPFFSTQAVHFSVLTPSPLSTQYSDWSVPVNLGPNVNSENREAQVSITHQGFSLYFDSDRPGGFGREDIYVCRRADLNSPWGTPMNLGLFVNSTDREFAPNFSPDDHWMYFASNRAGGFGGLDIWVSYRADINDDFGWQTPTNLGGSVNSSLADADAFYFVDPTTAQASLFFTSLNRPGGLGDWDIYQSTQNEDGSFGPAFRVSELSTPFRDTRMAIRSDGLEIIFSSNRPGGGGGIDLWVSTRPSISDLWSTPKSLGTVINTSIDDRAPYFSADDETLFFSSDRVDGALGGGDIWITTRTKLPIVKTRDIRVQANDSCTASVTPSEVDDGSFDPDDADTIQLSLDPAGPFGLGLHNVTLTAVDNHGASSSAGAILTVIDTTPPMITAASVDHATLWPPNHEMVNVEVRYMTTDNCGPVSTALSITSNEPVNGAGDGNTPLDWVVVDAHHVRLRAERSANGSGRIYTIRIAATDISLNNSSQSVTVHVPLN